MSLGHSHYPFLPGSLRAHGGGGVSGEVFAFELLWSNGGIFGTKVGRRQLLGGLVTLH